LVEHTAENRGVAGSIPALATSLEQGSREAGFAGLAALVDPSERAHGGNRVSPVKRTPIGRTAVPALATS
jgi:hypothetical protein